MLKIYLVDRGAEAWFGEYQSFVCIAKSENEARHMHPSGRYAWQDSGWGLSGDEDMRVVDWPAPDKVSVAHIGTAKKDAEKRIVLVSYIEG